LTFLFHIYNLSPHPVPSGTWGPAFGLRCEQIHKLHMAGRFSTGDCNFGNQEFSCPESLERQHSTSPSHSPSPAGHSCGAVPGGGRLASAPRLPSLRGGGSGGTVGISRPASAGGPSKPLLSGASTLLSLGSLHVSLLSFGARWSSFPACALLPLLIVRKLALHF